MNNCLLSHQARSVILPTESKRLRPGVRSELRFYSTFLHQTRFPFTLRGNIRQLVGYLSSQQQKQSSRVKGKGKPIHPPANFVLFLLRVLRELTFSSLILPLPHGWSVPCMGSHVRWVCNAAVRWWWKKPEGVILTLCLRACMNALGLRSNPRDFVPSMSCQYKKG